MLATAAWLYLQAEYLIIYQILTTVTGSSEEKMVKLVGMIFKVTCWLEAKLFS